MSFRSRRALVVLLALLGIVCAVAVTWATSQIVSQRIGLSSEPVTAGLRLMPARRGSGEPASTSTSRTTTSTTTVTTTTTTPSTAPPSTAPPSTEAQPAPTPGATGERAGEGDRARTGDD